MSTCNYTTQISGSECIGDSLTKINTNFSNLDESLCTLNTNFINLTSTIPSTTFKNKFFRATEIYPTTYTNTDLKLTQLYDNTYNVTANGTVLSDISATNIWRNLNNVQNSYSFASLSSVTVSSVDAQKNTKYVLLSSGTYHIQAASSLQYSNSHCLNLLKFNPLSGNYTSIAEGSLVYSDNSITSGVSGGPSTSFVEGRFTFTEATGVILFDVISSPYTTQVGALGFTNGSGGVPSWLTSYMPNNVTSWINIYCLD